MYLKKLAVFVALVVGALNASADTYKYSYTFRDGAQFSGTFDGTAVGNLVTGLTNVFANLNGTPLNGGSSLLTYSVKNGFVQTGGAAASFDGLQNNFWFMDAEFGTQTLEVVGGFVDGSIYGVLRADYINTRQNVFHSDYRSEYSASRWSLVAVPSVPEPESYALMLAGLGVVGVVARRRSRVG